MRVRFILFSVMLLIFVFFFSCTKDRSFIEIPAGNDLENLRITYLDGLAYADLMPSVPPDPLSIRIRLRLKNKSKVKTTGNLKFMNSKVFLFSDTLPGQITPYPEDHTALLPSATDTVTLLKQRENHTVFEPPCGKKIYVTFDIKDRFGNVICFRTDSMLFNCVY